MTNIFWYRSYHNLLTFLYVPFHTIKIYAGKNIQYKYSLNRYLSYKTILHPAKSYNSNITIIIIHINVLGFTYYTQVPSKMNSSIRGI